MIQVNLESADFRCAAGLIFPLLRILKTGIVRLSELTCLKRNCFWFLRLALIDLDPHPPGALPSDAPA